MKDHTGSIRGFYWSSRAWYARASRIDAPEITFGMFGEKGDGTSGEMVMRWHQLGGKMLCARLECFEDAWSALALFSDVIAELGRHDSERMTDSEFAKILEARGFKDLTEYKHPQGRCPECGQEMPT